MRKLKNFGLAFALTACVGLVGAGVITSAEDISQAEMPEEEQETEESAEDLDELIDSLGGESTASEDMTIQEVCRSAMPAMVAITNTSVEEVRNYFNGSPFDFFFGDYGFGDYYGRGYNQQPQTRESVSMGSGVIVGETDDDILIASNEHVISGISNNNLFSLFRCVHSGVSQNI